MGNLRTNSINHAGIETTNGLDQHRAASADGFGAIAMTPFGGLDTTAGETTAH